MRAREDRPTTMPNPLRGKGLDCGVRLFPITRRRLRWLCAGIDTPPVQVEPRAKGLFHASRSEVLLMSCTVALAPEKWGETQLQVLDYPCKSSDHLLEHAPPRWR